MPEKRELVQVTRSLPRASESPDDDNRLIRGTPAVRQKELKFAVLNRDGY